MRVLVVEDEESLGGVFHDFLIELGHQPLVVRTAEAALGQLETERPDAIILDINLPGMSGLDFLRLRPIRESGLPIVAVSGVVTETQARECLRLGALDFVGKPVPLDRLNEVLTYLEPHVLNRRLGMASNPERRQSSRVGIAMPVRVVEYNGSQWTGVVMNLSTSGVKIRAEGVVSGGEAVKLTFVPPDGSPEIQVMALRLRQEPDGYAFSFINLPARELHRLSDLIQLLGVAPR